MNNNSNYLTKKQPKLRFRGFIDKQLLNSKLLDLEEKKCHIDVNSKWFIDAPSIISGRYIKWTNQYHKNAPIDSIIYIKDGSNCGRFFYTCISTKIATTCDFIYTNQFNRYIYYLLKSKSEFFRKNLIKGKTIPHIYKKDIINEIIVIHKDINEQTKIANFLSLLDKQIDLYVRKLELTEILLKYLNFCLYKAASKNKILKFSDIFSSRIVKPIKTIDGYTPISIMLNGNGFKVSSLRIILSSKGRKYYERIPSDLTIGLQNFHNGSIGILPNEFKNPIMSSAIASFVNQSNIPLIVIKYILLNKKHQSYLKNIAEGTGQKEFTINKILNSKLPIPNNQDMIFFEKLLINIEKQIISLKKIIEFMNKRKRYYLNNLFI